MIAVVISSILLASHSITIQHVGRVATRRPTPAPGCTTVVDAVVENRLRDSFDCSSTRPQPFDWQLHSSPRFTLSLLISCYHSSPLVPCEVCPPPYCVVSVRSRITGSDCLSLASSSPVYPSIYACNFVVILFVIHSTRIHVSTPI
ncbi:hypothetical protein JAAARDRAFT_344415 [Jaapia argillacea MUCL 33604]|uniref:Secreted protein n=1 Tax=Jaapia argillacea MUCL 33604 TaxID=933084 RepID=A0A067PN17_9AGAM|nr:hypothetical protein JAAARDRAFT_344415 [Jaapia argillacea MUCL 33604]